MDGQLLVIFGLTFVIHVIGVLAYAARIAGTRTGRIAVSLALFNVLMLLSRLSNSFQAPLLAKRVEENLLTGNLGSARSDFRWLLVAPILATIVGALLIPTFQRLFGRMIESFSVHRSVPRLLLHSFSKAGLAHIRDAIRIPAGDNVTQLREPWHVPVGVLVANVIATAVWTVGVFASLYAGYFDPHLRVTASNLSAIINGGATILMFLLIDPYLSVLTDDVVQGKSSDSLFRKTLIWLLASRLAGTVLAQVLLVPAANVITFVARGL